MNKLMISQIPKLKKMDDSQFHFFYREAFKYNINILDQNEELSEEQVKIILACLNEGERRLKELNNGSTPFFKVIKKLYKPLMQLIKPLPDEVFGELMKRIFKMTEIILLKNKDNVKLINIEIFLQAAALFEFPLSKKMQNLC